MSFSIIDWYRGGTSGKHVRCTIAYANLARQKQNRVKLPGLSTSSKGMFGSFLDVLGAAGTQSSGAEGGIHPGGAPGTATAVLAGVRAATAFSHSNSSSP